MAHLKRVAIIVGEQSGDILGAGLIQALQKQFPLCTFEGIGGEKMIALGFKSHFPLERLAVMGLIDPLKRLPELLSIRKSLKHRYFDNPPDVFIGIDSPDFNMNLENYLKNVCNVPVVHYVSPSVWAWRKGRIKKIAKSVDLMLTLFPFESKFYSQHNVKNACVGHPLADELPLNVDTKKAREKLDLNFHDNDEIVGLLPGSRKGEVEQLCATLLASAELILKKMPHVKFIIPAANQARYQQIKQIFGAFSHLPVHIILGDSHNVMAASNVIVIASGTATLEAMLLKKPMVIVYRLSNLSYFILNKMISTKFIGLPNILADKKMVPELIQDAANPENISQHILTFLSDQERSNSLIDAFTTLHILLKKNASEVAAAEIVAMLD